MCMYCPALLHNKVDPSLWSCMFMWADTSRDAGRGSSKVHYFRQNETPSWSIMRTSTARYVMETRATGSDSSSCFHACICNSQSLSALITSPSQLMLIHLRGCKRNPSSQFCFPSTPFLSCQPHRRSWINCVNKYIKIIIQNPEHDFPQVFDSAGPACLSLWCTAEVNSCLPPLWIEGDRGPDRLFTIVLR